MQKVFCHAKNRPVLSGMTILCKNQLDLFAVKKVTFSPVSNKYTPESGR